MKLSNIDCLSFELKIFAASSKLSDADECRKIAIFTTRGDGMAQR